MDKVTGCVNSEVGESLQGEEEGPGNSDSYIPPFIVNLFSLAPDLP